MRKLKAGDTLGTNKKVGWAGIDPDTIQPQTSLSDRCAIVAAKLENFAVCIIQCVYTEPSKLRAGSPWMSTRQRRGEGVNYSLGGIRGCSSCSKVSAACAKMVGFFCTCLGPLEMPDFFCTCSSRCWLSLLYALINFQKFTFCVCDAFLQVHFN